MTEELVTFQTRNNQEGETDNADVTVQGHETNEEIRGTSSPAPDEERGAIREADEGVSDQAHPADGESSAASSKGGSGDSSEQEKQQPVLEEKKDDVFSRRFAALSKRERELYQKHRGIKEQEKEIERLRHLEDIFNKRDFAALEKQGISYEDWTKHILSDGDKGPQSDIDEVKKELASIKKDREVSQQQELNNTRYSTYVAEIGNIDKYCTENEEKFPLVNLFQDTQMIFDIRAEKFKQDQDEYGPEYAQGNVMSVEQATGLAEGYREEMLKSRKGSLKSFRGKIETILGQSSAPATEDTEEAKALKKAEEENQLPVQSRAAASNLPNRTKRLLGVRTLTNNNPIPSKEKRDFKTDKERLAHAASLLKYDEETYTGFRQT